MNRGCQKCSDVDRVWVFLWPLRAVRALRVRNDVNSGREADLPLWLQANLYQGLGRAEVTVRLSAYKGAAQTFHLPLKQLDVGADWICFFFFNFCELIPARLLTWVTLTHVCSASARETSASPSRKSPSHPFLPRQSMLKINSISQLQCTPPQKYSWGQDSREKYARGLQVSVIKSPN